MAERRRANPRVDFSDMPVRNRQDVDQVDEAEMVFDTAYIDMDLPITDVQIDSDEVSLLAIIQYRNNKQRSLLL